MKNLVIFALFVCLNGELWKTNKPITYGVPPMTVIVDKAVYTGQTCLGNHIFESTFEVDDGIEQVSGNEKTHSN